VALGSAIGLTERWVVTGCGSDHKLYFVSEEAHCVVRLTECLFCDVIAFFSAKFLSCSEAGEEVVFVSGALVKGVEAFVPHVLFSILVLWL
jgi:hypothetical protein